MNRRVLTLAFSALLLNASAQSTLSNKDVEEMTWVEAMQDYRVNYHTVVDKFEDFWGDRTYEKGSGYKQFKRWEYFMGQRVDADGNRPHPNVLYQAIQQQSSSNQFGDWKPMGPYDAPSNSGIGRINCVSFHPNHADTIYAGAPSGGLWVSYDDGQNWQTHTDELTNIGVSDLAIDPIHPDTMYLATGDRDAGDTYSFGLLKSTDGGYTWTTTGLSFNVNNYNRIAKVLIHPVQHNVIIVATNSGIYRSTNYGSTFTLETSGNYIDLEHGGGQTYFASENGSNPSILRSTNMGDTWSQVSTGLPSSGTYRAAIAVAPSDTSRVYALFGNNNYGFGGLYRSTNGGTTWTSMSTTPNIMGWDVNGSGGTDGQAWYDMSLAVDPGNASRIFVGGVNIWRSNNGGASWSCVGHWWGASGTPYVHADHHSADFRPGTSQLYVGTDGGVYKTDNSGSNWSHLNDGMNITQYYKISQSVQDSLVVLAGAQDNGTHLRTGTFAFDQVYGGDGMDNAVDAANDSYMYCSIYYGQFGKSTNGGNSFSSINTLSPSGTGNWVTPMKADPVTGGTVYTGFTRIWKSTNYGQTWSATSATNVGSGNIDEFSIAPSNTNYIYAVNESSLYRSTNGGTSFSNITPSGSASPGGNKITFVAVDPDDEEHIMISVSGYTAGTKVMVSTDAGSTWTNLSSGLPNVPANCVIFEGSTENGMYVGTDIGVYYRNDQTGGWLNFGKGMPNVIVTDFDLLESENILRAGTYGRGIYQSVTYADQQNPPVAQMNISPSTTCSVSDTVILEDLSINLPTSWKWTVFPAGSATFVGGTTDTSQIAKVVFTAAGIYSVKLEATNAFGSDDTIAVAALRVGGQSLPFVEDFEGATTSEWSVVNGDNSYTWNLTASNGTAPGSMGVTVNHYNYSAQGERDELISPPLSFASDTNIFLTFEFAKASYDASYHDSLEVDISTDCGATWTNLLLLGAQDSTWLTAGMQTSPWIPSSSADWCMAYSVCPSIDLNAYSGMSGIRIRFVAINGYGNNTFLDNINITGDAKTPPVAAFTGDTAGCSGSAYAFTDLSLPAATSRTWLFPGATPGTSTDANPVVTYANSGSYDVTLIVSNAAGSDTLVKTAYVNVAQSPTPSVSLTNVTGAGCAGDSISFTAAPTNGGAQPTYQWYVNGSAVPGATSSTFASTSLSNGDQIKVEMTSTEECISGVSVADSLSVTVHPLPTVTLSALGTICALDAPLALSGGLPTGGIYTGAGVTANTFDPASVPVGVHTITYTYTDPTTGCSNSKQKSLLVLSAPTQPTVSQLATGELEAATPAGVFTYQWLDNAMDPISGATSSTYMPLANGDYYVTITSNVQCSNTSDAFTVLNIGLDEELLDGFALYPNPAVRTLHLRSANEVTIQILDASGRTVYQANLQGDLQLDVQDWARGTYMLQVLGENQRAIPLILQ